MARVTPIHPSASGLTSELCSLVRSDQGNTELLKDEAEAIELHGATKNASRVKPKCISELIPVAGFTKQLARCGQGKTEPIPTQGWIGKQKLCDSIE